MKAQDYSNEFEKRGLENYSYEFYEMLENLFEDSEEIPDIEFLATVYTEYCEDIGSGCALDFGNYVDDYRLDEYLDWNAIYGSNEPQDEYSDQVRHLAGQHFSNHYLTDWNCILVIKKPEDGKYRNWNFLT